MSPGAAEWVAKADNDFQSMHWELKRQPTANYDDVCFHAQQCIEKLMKAVLMENSKTFPKTHDLFELAKAVQNVVPSWSFAPADLADLMPGAVTFRYPGVNATAADAQTAIGACMRLRPTLLVLL